MARLTKFWRYPLVFTVILLAISAFADGGPHFAGVLERNPDAVWNPGVNSKLKDSLRAFKNHRKLSNGLAYGSMVQHLNLEGLCPEKIEAWAAQHACSRQDDVLKEPKRNAPIHDTHGNTIPLVSYLCPDGGVIRTKPQGDPTSPFDRAPLASIAMRFFGSDRYENFSDEAFKIDSAGLAIPKWPKDLNLELQGLSKKNRKAYVDEWARDAHTHLTKCQ